jgi:hypothetical protein
MKKLFVLLLIIYSFSLVSCIADLVNVVFISGSNTSNPDDPVKPVTTDDTSVPMDSFFWGTWVRMDNGKEYKFLEKSVKYGNREYFVESSTDTVLKVNNIGTFNKQSDSIIVNDNIPYFRQGGTNLEYSFKLVGFTGTGGANASVFSRAGTSGLSGIKGKGKSTTYTSFESEAESDSDGKIVFKAPTAGDVQTVEIQNGNQTITIPEIQITNAGDYMGTVALVAEDQYNLKITGDIPYSQKDNGYLYANSEKKYPMEVTITNISDVDCRTSVCRISSDDPNLIIESDSENININAFTISTLKPGLTKSINLKVSYATLNDPYIDTGISVLIRNPTTDQEWTDFIPLRFFKTTLPVTVSAKSPQNNSNAALNGFIIYPDGNNQFFSIPDSTYKSIYVPSFPENKSFMLVFSGATVTWTLSDSTEMYYTVAVGKVSAKNVVTTSDSIDELSGYIAFGGENHTENDAYFVENDFEAYLQDGEIDFYIFNVK